MNQQTLTGIAILRISLGVIYLAHGPYLKLVVFGMAGTAQFFGSLGLPEFSAYLVVAAETVGGVALIAGYKARWAALALLPIALGAIWVHFGADWLFTNEGGGWEYPAFLAAATAAQALLGNGAWGLEPSVNRAIAG